MTDLTIPVLPLRAIEDYFRVPASDALVSAFESLEHLWDVEIAIWMSVLFSGPAPFVAHAQSLFLQPTSSDAPSVVQKWDNGYKRVDVETVKDRLEFAELARLEAGLREVADDWYGGVFIEGDVGFRVREIAVYTDTVLRFFWQPGTKAADWFDAKGIYRVSNLLHHLMQMPEV